MVAPTGVAGHGPRVSWRACVMKKTCFKCGVEKLLSEFYRHTATADGHLGKCVECTRADVRAHRAANLDKVRQYDRARSDLPHRAELRRLVTSAWRRRFPERGRASVRVRRAVIAGRLAKPSRCEMCNCVPLRIEGHHFDYSQPLVVAWLCKPCHAFQDKVRRIAEAC